MPGPVPGIAVSKGRAGRTRDPNGRDRGPPADDELGCLELHELLPRLAGQRFREPTGEGR